MKNKLEQIFKRYKNHSTQIIKKDKELLEFINVNTSFLPNNASIQERCFCILNNMQKRPVCPVCGKDVKFYVFSVGYRNTCSAKCGHKFSVNRFKETCLARYGVTNPNKLKSIKDKKKSVFIKKFGVDNPCKNKTVQEKRKKTCLNKFGATTNLNTKEQRDKNKILSVQKYGTLYPTQSEDIKEKTKQTCIKKYGVPFVRQVIEFQDKAKKTCMQKYGVDNIFKQEILQDKIRTIHKQKFFEYISTSFECIPLFNVSDYIDVKTVYKWKCKKCASVFSSDLNNGLRPICPLCYPKSKSTPQQQIYEYLKTIIPDIVIFQNTRKVIPPLELDFYIPDTNLAIELNGNYWHSQLGGGVNKNYHLKKLNECAKRNIRLIQIFEDEWLFKTSIVKNRIKHILQKTQRSIFARKCTIQLISSDKKNIFLNKYHIQGSDKSSICLGAYYKKRLVAVMTFGLVRVALGNKENCENCENYELMRFATVFHFNIPGIASKMLRFFETHYTFKCLTTYADRRWSIGSMYEKIGFKLDHISKPNYWYMKTYLKRLHRFNFAKHSLKRQLGELFDPSLSEWQNMKNAGYDRIWDCGNYIFKKMINI